MGVRKCLRVIRQCKTFNFPCKCVYFIPSTTKFLNQNQLAFCKLRLWISLDNPIKQCLDDELILSINKNLC